MEIMIELTEVELDLVTGGLGVAAFQFTNFASGNNLALAVGVFGQETTESFAAQAGTFVSISD